MARRIQPAPARRGCVHDRADARRPCGRDRRGTGGGGRVRARWLPDVPSGQRQCRRKAPEVRHPVERGLQATSDLPGRRHSEPVLRLGHEVGRRDGYAGSRRFSAQEGGGSPGCVHDRAHARRPCGRDRRGTGGAGRVRPPLCPGVIGAGPGGYRSHLPNPRPTDAPSPEYGLPGHSGLPYRAEEAHNARPDGLELRGWLDQDSRCGQVTAPACHERGGLTEGGGEDRRRLVAPRRPPALEAGRRGALQLCPVEGEGQGTRCHFGGTASATVETGCPALT